MGVTGPSARVAVRLSLSIARNLRKNRRGDKRRVMFTVTKLGEVSLRRAAASIIPSLVRAAHRWVGRRQRGVLVRSIVGTHRAACAAAQAEHGDERAQGEDGEQKEEIVIAR